MSTVGFGDFAIKAGAARIIGKKIISKLFYFTIFLLFF